MAIISARADVGYQQGLDRMWSRTDRYSCYHPLLQGIGDQAILNSEIYAVDPATDTGSTGTPDNDRTFAYAERYSEYKFQNDGVTGLFRSNCTSSLESRHLIEEFSSAPSFNQTFLNSNTPADRVIAVSSQPHLSLDMHFNIQAARPMHTTRS